MDRAASDYAQSDQASSAQYTPQTDVRSSTLSNSNTPQSDYGLNPSSARSGGFPEYLTRQPQYHHAPSSHPGSVASMAQATNPSIAQSSPTYPPPYSPYNPQHPDMSQYQGHPPPAMYGRPDWPPQYAHGHGMPGPYSSPATSVGSGSPAVSAGNRPGQLYSFVSIPGAQQHKRPRRRYEEIERMYKCGWNGCEKAYGTLNHLNAHVTMQSHGAKRTPEEFKEIRKEWKARKKEEETQRKAADERERAQAQANQVDGQSADPSQQGQAPNYPANVRPQLPPIGYAPADGQVPGQYAGQQPGMVYQQSNGQMGYPANYPHSPYAQGGQVYQQQYQHNN